MRHNKMNKYAKFSAATGLTVMEDHLGSSEQGPFIPVFVETSDLHIDLGKFGEDTDKVIQVLSADLWNRMVEQFGEGDYGLEWNTNDFEGQNIYIVVDEEELTIKFAKQVKEFIKMTGLKLFQVTS